MEPSFAFPPAAAVKPLRWARALPLPALRHRAERPIAALMRAMAMLERDGDWAPLGAMLSTLEPPSAVALHGALLAAWDQEQQPQIHIMPGATIAVLAVLIAIASSPAKGLALLDRIERRRGDADFMAPAWLARCHMLQRSATITAFWPEPPPGSRLTARNHVLAGDVAAALDNLAQAPERAETGRDLAALAVWLAAQGLVEKLQQHEGLTRRMASDPAIPRAAMEHLLRAPALPGWDMLRESWLDQARACFRRFVPRGPIRAPEPPPY